MPRGRPGSYSILIHSGAKREQFGRKVPSTMKSHLLVAGKVFLAALIVIAVGRRFYLDLRDLDPETLTIRPGWLALSGVLYLLGLGFWCVVWCRLLGICGQDAPWPAAVRAYYVGHLGKYVPGKAWTLLLRGVMIRGPGVRLTVAVVTAGYEVLITMAAGALLAAAIFAFLPPDIPGLTWSPVFFGLMVLGLVALPFLPRVLNWLVSILAVRFQKAESFTLPSLHMTTLLGGLLIAGAGWLFLGAGLWAVLQGVLPEPPGLTLDLGLECLAALGTAYVAGFLAIVVPGGIGVREYVLVLLLPPLADESHLVVAAVVLRLVGTAAEVLMAAAVYGWPAARSAPLPKPALSAKKE
jgi:glycosyltransferase 2 family protein